MSTLYYLLTNLLKEDERKVLASIIDHIEKGDKRVGIQQIADENFVSTAFIMKMCKRLNYDGYSELYYHLTLQSEALQPEKTNCSLEDLLDQFHAENIQKCCELLDEHREHKIFAIGGGFSALVADYLVQRLSISGFMVFNSVHFYDYMVFRAGQEEIRSNVEPSILFAISQSGEAEAVLRDARNAKERGYKIISFTRNRESTLAELSDLVFMVEETDQTLISGLPNLFFGKVILVFEQLVAAYFDFLSDKKKKSKKKKKNK